MSNDLDILAKFFDIDVPKDDMSRKLEAQTPEDVGIESVATTQVVTDVIDDVVKPKKPAVKPKTKAKVKREKNTDITTSSKPTRKRALPSKLSLYSMPTASKRSKQEEAEPAFGENDEIVDETGDDDNNDEDYEPDDLERRGSNNRSISAVKTKQEIFECTRCKTVYYTAVRLIEHIRTSHKDINIEWKPTVSRHSTTHPMIGNEVFRDAVYHLCYNCRFVTHEYDEFAVHMKSEHNESIDFCCSRCEFQTAEYERYLTHINSCNSTRVEPSDQLTLVQCEYGSCCYYKASNGSVDYNAVFWCCAGCLFNCSEIKLYHEHMKTVHSQVIDYECYNCDQKYSEFKDYVKHRNHVHSHVRTKSIAKRKMKYMKQSKKSKDYEWVPANFGKYNVLKKFATGIDYSIAFRRCDKCDFHSMTYKRFADHMLSVHEEVIDYECNNCEAVLKTLKQYGIHKLRKQCTLTKKEFAPAAFGKYNVHKIENGVIKTDIIYRHCDKCNFVTISYKFFAAHMLRSHKETIAYGCSRCEAEFDTFESYDEHRKRNCMAKQIRAELQLQADAGHEISRTQCQYKDYIYLVNYSSGQVKPIYICDECEYWESHSILDHSIHRRDSHNDTKYSFCCSDCEYQSDNYINFKKHRVSHSDNTTLLCDSCNYVASNWRTLNVHVHRHTGERPFLCDICGSSFLSTKRMRQHKLIHSSGFQYKCGHVNCDYATNHLTALNKHRASQHLTEHDKYKCSGCDYTTKFLEHLKRHLRIHLGMMEFKCPDCDFMSYEQHSVRRHMIKHTNVAEYVCDTCGLSTSTLHNLRLHTMAHEGIKPYKCSVCGFQSLYKRKIKRHITRIHPGQNGICIDTGARLNYKVKKTNNLHHDKVMRVIYGLKDLTDTDATLQLYVKEIRNVCDNEIITLQCDKCTYVNRSSNAFILHRLIAHTEGIQLPPITDPTRRTTPSSKLKSKNSKVPVMKLSTEEQPEEATGSVTYQSLDGNEQLVTTYVGLLDNDSTEVIHYSSDLTISSEIDV
ncbi:uncharacterized protein LOC141905868 [Tubulanus polymorphus]|uniref:uncharacterized protein LOC141905868 n=1 Tax=Tubulanus polymorphus TaxID=672921 RepID=UPI003DA2B9B5